MLKIWNREIFTYESSGSQLIDGYSQIHMHFNQKELDGYYPQVEICCHGCQTSANIIYIPKKLCLSLHVTPGEQLVSLLNFTDNFVHNHMNCENLGYIIDCPGDRNTVNTEDLRPDGYPIR